MRNLRIALGLRLLRPELRALTYDAYRAFEDVTDHNARHGGYVQGVYSGLLKIGRLRKAFTPAETVERFTCRW
jgi:hypothetical protein